jgi:isopenicillin N synthase-like dioxygenase
VQIGGGCSAHIDYGMALPIIDMTALFGSNAAARAAVASGIERACRDTGFFYVTGHGIPAALIGKLDELARKFFALPENQKMHIAMARGGRAWRGYFPVGGELTSGRPDLKEGLYLGTDHRVLPGRQGGKNHLRDGDRGR